MEVGRHNGSIYYYNLAETRDERMKQFSLDEAINSVKNQKTKMYLEEVISSYNNGNYRSCIVVLYSIVIYDIYHKIKILAEFYDDSAAKQYFVDIENVRGNENKLSDWENKVLEKSFNTQLFNEIEKEQIRQLKQYRNWSAHPVVGHDFDLVSPTKETALCHLRNMFEALFEKDVVLAKKVLDNILADIELFSEREGIGGFSDDFCRLQQYIDTRYFKYFNDNTAKYIFKNLWTIVFYCIDENSNRYRICVLMVLISLTKKYKKLFINTIKEEVQYFNNKILTPTKSLADIEMFYELSRIPMTSLIYFFSTFSSFFEEILDDKKIEIECFSDKSINLFALAYFRSIDLPTHFKQLKEKIKTYTYKTTQFSEQGSRYAVLEQPFLLHLLEISKEYSCKKEFIDFLIDYLSDSPQRYSASKILDTVQKILCEFDKDDYDKLLMCMNGKYEIYSSAEIGNSVTKIINSATTIGHLINVNTYPNLNR